eukprot:SAG31_NODE_25952_length_451_cov_0.730114_1_plen_44_part_10
MADGVQFGPGRLYFSSSISSAALSTELMSSVDLGMVPTTAPLAT